MRVIFVAVCFVWVGSQALAADMPLAVPYLTEGRLADGISTLNAYLIKQPKDDQARLGLGTIQFVKSIERLSQSLYRYGLRGDRGLMREIPFLRLPIPVNEKPEAISYEAGRTIIITLLDDLTTTEATLARITDEKVKMPLPIGAIRLDLTGSGKPGDRFATILTRYMGGNQVIPENLEIAFDRGDVTWLRGYCHLLMAFCEVILAHDGQELFECTAHVVFPKVITPHAFIKTLPEPKAGFDYSSLVDLITVIHLLRFPVKDAGRMKSALAHLEQTLELSVEMWKQIQAETDDDREWIPNARQKGSLGVAVSQSMIDSWLLFVAEAKDLLAGKRLIPFWRGDEKRGVNLRKVFTEPRSFDLVLWIQGTAATPYLEEGPMTRQQTWDRLQRVFGGQFFGMALWFN